jgi:hypothetical protein
VSNFSLPLLQAINNWQRGFNHEQKPKRIAALKSASADLDQRYRVLTEPCYRQLTLEPRYVMEMGLRYRIQEATSSWTFRLDVAEQFKGGVAPKDMELLPVIVRTLPDPEAVVINLAALYADSGFLAAVDQHQNDIKGFWDGIGRWRDSQAEVVLELDVIYLHEVHAAGGHSSPRETILQHPRVIEELLKLEPEAFAIVEKAIAKGQGEFGPHWLKDAAKDRVLRKWIEEAERITAERQATSAGLMPTHASPTN